MKKYYYLFILLALFIAILTGLYLSVAPIIKLRAILYGILAMNHTNLLIYVMLLISFILVTYLILRLVIPPTIIRIIPVANGKIYLIGKDIQMEEMEKPLLFFDAPVMTLYRSFLSPRESFIRHLAKPLTSVQPTQVRLLARYSVCATDGSQKKRIHLYILPLKNEEDVQPGGVFISIDQIPETRCNPLLKIEKNYLKMAANAWEQYGTPHL